MTDFDPQSFAQDWIAAWNRRDIAHVVGHYAEDCEFVSPLAAKVTGLPLVRGREALRAYWKEASEGIALLKFTLDSAYWDGRVLCVVYLAETDGRRRRACELMTFDETGRIIRGEALYGGEI